MLPDLNRLKIFSFVYTNRSVSKAARELNLSQPAVSQHLKKLENELRIPLFTRTNRKIVPTPAAERLFARMSPLIDELHEEIKYLRRPLDTPFGLLRIGAPEIIGANILTSIFNKFRFRFPTVTFTLDCADNRELLSALSQGTIDLALIERSPEPGDTEIVNPLYYSSETLLSGPQIMVCSRIYFNRNIAGKTDFEHLLKRDYLTTNSDTMDIDQWFQHHHKRIPYKLNYVMTTDNHQAFLDGIRNGMGLGVIPYNLVRREIESGSLSCVSGTGNEIISTLSLVQLKNKIPSLTEKAFTAVLKKELGQSARHNPALP